MKFLCTLPGHSASLSAQGSMKVDLYSRSSHPDVASAGAAVKETMQRQGLRPDPRAWDLLSIGLSVVTADRACSRSTSPDGWTREISLVVSVAEPEFWSTQKSVLETALRFLTTDIWEIEFLPGGYRPQESKKLLVPEENCIVLLSGGLDSLVGVLDLCAAEETDPWAVSQVAGGDKKRQALFAQSIRSGIRHLQLNHNASCPPPYEQSQRSRSLIFLAYGVLAATSLASYQDGAVVRLYVCENGFISINPPLTGSRLGSLSTRTTHPYFLGLFRELVKSAGLRVEIVNPYQFRTKGEMLVDCKNQELLRRLASESTSCGRFGRTGYRHCGRCTPCLIRRAAFHAWDGADSTGYVYSDLSRDDVQHARFDDVRAVAMALAEVEMDGLNSWLGASLSTTQLGEVAEYEATVQRGLVELATFLESMGVE